MDISNKVFISYSSKDREFVLQLAERMRNDLADIWIAEWEIDVGDSIIEKISEGIKDSSYFLIIISRNSIESDWVKREMNSALMRQLSNRDIKILPVLLDMDYTELPPLLIGIHAVRFIGGIIDKDGYKKLIKPIMDKQKEEYLAEFQDSYYQNIELIDNILTRSKPAKQEIKFIISLLSEDHYNRYFFRNVKSHIWFKVLKNVDFFNLDQNPKPIKNPDGTFTIQKWNALEYLEVLSKDLAVSKDETLSQELLSIIENTTQSQFERKKEFDNIYTWSSFLQIILNLPKDHVHSYVNKKSISTKIWFDIWTKSKFGSDFIASELLCKLLPKYLTPVKDDIELAESIMQAVTGIDLQDIDDIKKTFQKEKYEVSFFTSPYWVLKAFSDYTSNIGNFCTSEFIYHLANKLKQVLENEQTAAQIDIEKNNEVFRLRLERIINSPADLAFHNYVCLIGKMTKDELLAAGKDDILKQYSFMPKALHTFTIRDCESSLSFVKQIVAEMSKVVDQSFINSHFDGIKLYRSLYMDRSYIWYRSLFNNARTGAHRPNEVLTNILKNTLLTKCQNNKEMGIQLLFELLSDKYKFTVFRRIVVYVLTLEFNSYKEVFRELISRHKYIFTDPSYEVELYRLFQMNINRFSNSEKRIVESILNEGPEIIPDEEKDQYVNYWKQKWYSYLAADNQFRELYEVQKKKTGIKQISPPDEDAIKMRWGPGPSPLNKNAILEMENSEIVKYLKSFKEDNTWEGPKVLGLAEELKSAVRERPAKFTNQIENFEQTAYVYVYNILSGLKEAWKEKKIFNWGNLLDFGSSYIQQESFIKSAKRAQGEDWLPSHVWILNVLADLIQDGTQKDDWAFEEELLPKAEDLLGTILLRLDQLPPSASRNGYKDAVTAALNTSYGSALIALILLSLRKTRLEAKHGIIKEPKWKPDKYEKLIQKGVVEAYTLLGQYMSNFSYLNRSWLESKIRDFADRFDISDIEWKSFFEGYLYISNVYEEFYLLMREHYSKAINYEFTDISMNERFAQHIVVGYLRGNEDIENVNSLFYRMLNNWKFSQLEAVVNFIWSQGVYLVKNFEKSKDPQGDQVAKQRMMEFWCWTYVNRDILKSKLGKDYSKFLSSLPRLTILLENINPENIQWIKLSLPHLDTHESSYFIDYLEMFNDDESISYVGQLIFDALPVIDIRYKRDELATIVRKLYQKGYVDIGDRICNTCGSIGYEFLKPIYKEYRQ